MPHWVDYSLILGYLVPVFLVWSRIVGLFLSAPVIGGTYVPLRIKVLLSLALTAVLAPLHLDQWTPGRIIDGRVLLLIAGELAIGLILGFLINLYFLAVRFGGDLIGRTVGFAMAEVFDPGSEQMAGPVGDLFYITIVLLFFLVDAHHLFFTGLSYSFDVIALGGITLRPELHMVVARAGQECFVFTMTLAFPVLAAAMLVTVAEGVIARAVPQINILHITFATKIIVFLVVLYSGLAAAVALMAAILYAAQGLLVDAVPVLAS